MKKEECPRVIVFGNGLGNTLGLIRSVGECGVPVTLILEPGRKALRQIVRRLIPG